MVVTVGLLFFQLLSPIALEMICVIIKQGRSRK